MQSKVIMMRKVEANAICGTLTQTTKMPCKSYSLPTEACQTGYRMAQINGSICSSCYADKGFYRAYANTIKPAQFARLDAINDPLWVDGMVSLIGNDSYFRFHDSGDLQGVDHLRKIAQIADRLPKCLFWLPTREYAMIKQYIDQFGALPKNLFVRLSAMYPDKPVIIPKSLQGFKNITASNVHTNKPIGKPCVAPEQNGECKNCRACWTNAVISYKLH
jgi:hypothetical protein